MFNSANNKRLCITTQPHASFIFAHMHSGVAGDMAVAEADDVAASIGGAAFGPMPFENVSRWGGEHMNSESIARNIAMKQPKAQQRC